MKIKTKLSIAAAVLVSAGLMLFVTGMSLLGWDFKRLDISKYTAKSFTVENADDVKSVEVSMSSFPLDIVSGDVLKLDYYEATGCDVFVLIDDDTLKIVEKYKYQPFDTGFFNIGRGDHRYVLTVPHATDISFVGVNCDISVKDMRFGSLRIDSTNVDMTLDNVEMTGDIYLKAQNANVCLTNVVTTSIEAFATNLDVEIYGCELGEALADGTNADVTVNDSQIGEATFRATNLNVEANRASIGKCSVSGTNADIELNTFTVESLFVKGGNLDAYIEIAGIRSEYSVITKGNDLPPAQIGSTEKTITLEGGNNSVQLKFV